MRVFRFEDDEWGWKCGYCNWNVRNPYVLAESREEALSLLERGEAGLCGDCFCDLLIEMDAEICQASRV